MSECSFFLHGGNPVLIRDSSADGFGRLAGLAGLAGGRFIPFAGAGSPAVELLSGAEVRPGREVSLLRWHCGEFFYVPEGKSFRFLLSPERRQLPLRAQVCLWRLAVVAACYAEILRGRPLMLLHGAALRTGGGLLLLCGPGGVGKTTTAGRWRAAGEETPCDDQMLLEETDTGIAVHPLPTWSRCAVNPEPEAVNFAETGFVRAVFALKRSEPGEERLEKTDLNIYYSSIYSACCFFLLPIIRKMPAAEQLQLRRAAVSWTERIAAGERRTLYADRDGDLQRTLAAYR